MSGPEFEQPESSDEKTAPKTAAQEVEPEVYPDEMKLEPLMRAEKLSAEINRFGSLSSELTELLSGLSREIKISAEQLNRIRTAVQITSALG